MGADYYQTRDITSRCIEMNPLIGECGQRIPPEYYFPLVFLAQLLVLGHVPKDYRLLVNGLVIGAETATIFLNTRP